VGKGEDGGFRHPHKVKLSFSLLFFLLEPTGSVFGELLQTSQEMSTTHPNFIFFFLSRANNFFCEQGEVWGAAYSLFGPALSSKPLVSLQTGASRTRARRVCVLLVTRSRCCASAARSSPGATVRGCGLCGCSSPGSGALQTACREAGHGCEGAQGNPSLHARSFSSSRC